LAGEDFVAGSREAGSFLVSVGAGVCSSGGIGLDGAELASGVAVVATIGATAGVVETDRAENCHHTAAIANTAAAPIRIGVSADRRLVLCSAATLAVGVIFCPVSGDASEPTGMAVIDTIA
jgi:hypothetical protein